MVTTVELLWPCESGSVEKPTRKDVGPSGRLCCVCSGFVENRQVLKKKKTKKKLLTQGWIAAVYCCFLIWIFPPKKGVKTVMQRDSPKAGYFPLCCRRLLLLKRPTGRVRRSSWNHKLLRCMFTQYTQCTQDELNCRVSTRGQKPVPTSCCQTKREPEWSHI